MATIIYRVGGGAEQSIAAPYGQSVEIPGSAGQDVTFRVETDEQTAVYVAPVVTDPPGGGGGSVGVFTPTPAPAPSADDNPAPATTADAISITPLTYDRWVYDVGAARGENSANLPISGTATANGATIYARPLRDDTNAPIGDWQEVGAVQPDGSWGGTVPCPCAPWPVRIEVAEAAGTVLSPADRRYMAGHVIAAYGQSWTQRPLNFASSAPFNTTVQHPDNGGTVSTDVPDQVQIIGQGFDGSGAMGNTRRMFVRDDEAVVANSVRFANHWAAVAPGQPLCVIVQARGATGINDLMDDDLNNAASQRQWATDDKSVYDLGRTDGREPGLVWADWYQNLIPLGDDVSDLLHLFLFSALADGTPVQSSMAAGSDQSFVGVEGTYGFDRSIMDLYNIAPGATLIALSGPHRNEYDVLNRNGSSVPADWTLDAAWPIATYLTSQNYDANPAAIGRDLTRAAYEAAATNPLVVAQGTQMQNLECWGDTQHTAATSNGLSEDGDWLWEAAIAWNIASFFRLNTYFTRADQPVISRATYHDDYIEVEFSDETGAGQYHNHARSAGRGTGAGSACTPYGCCRFLDTGPTSGERNHRGWTCADCADVWRA